MMCYLSRSHLATTCTLVAITVLMLVPPIRAEHYASSLTVEEKELECGMRALALDFARTIQPWRETKDELWRQIHDALQLTTMCGRVPPAPTSTNEGENLDGTAKQSALRNLKNEQPGDTKPNKEENILFELCSDPRQVLCIFVTSNSSAVGGNGTLANPLNCLHKALNMSRTIRQKSHEEVYDFKPTKIILRQGTHNLYFRTLHLLGEIDSNLEIMGYPKEEVWISGGVPIVSNSNTTTGNLGVDWKQSEENPNVWVADLTDLLGDQVYKVPHVTSLFTTGSQHRRYIRARYPNGDPEIHQWGYNSPGRHLVSIPSDVALEWHKPPQGEVPKFEYFANLKNDSTMEGYNLYASGSGGACADVWGPQANSYWCSNASAGGWAEVDSECAISGKMQLPMGVTWNTSTKDGKYLSSMASSANGGLIFAWHSQSWAMHMFEIDGVPNDDQFHFAKGGGRQGGRNWCRCDQCTYAGGWCGQHQNPPNKTDSRLIGGSWFIENVLSELDQPGEFYFNHDNNHLYIYPNATKGDISWQSNLRFSILETILDLRNVSNVLVSNVGFRDAAPTFMSDWSAPSGGDWSLHRGGALFLENVRDVIIRQSTFRRLDGNAVFLSRRNRNVLIEKNSFEWLGENAIATWGQTDAFNATSGDQPWGTMIHDNVMRELGIYEKQSSAFGQAKAALSDVRNNIMFNMPRAAINFNDGMGGGDRIYRNLLFNTCRESGDHGPINSWDRQPFLTTLRDGKTPSFNPLPRKISENLIFAHYGADQGVDNDDGSSWFHISRNVFFAAAGFKMDYGGHDSVFEDNLVVATGNKNCIGFGSFKPGHGHIVRNNKCIAGVARRSLSGWQQQQRKQISLRWSADCVGGLQHCQGGNAVLLNNSYYTPHGNASFACEFDNEVSLEDMQKKFGLEIGSTAAAIPDSKTIVQWSYSLLMT